MSALGCNLQMCIFGCDLQGCLFISILFYSYSILYYTVHDRFLKISRNLNSLHFSNISNVGGIPLNGSKIGMLTFNSEQNALYWVKYKRVDDHDNYIGDIIERYFLDSHTTEMVAWEAAGVEGKSQKYICCMLFLWCMTIMCV